jgi:membrane protease YdiL (CAAX protease family)
VAKKKEAPAKPPPKGYFQQSKDPLNALVLVIPVLLVYQAGLLMTKGKVLNGVDLISVVLVAKFDWWGLFYFNLALVLLGVGGVFYLRRKHEFTPKIMLPMAAESTVYAFLLGYVIVGIMSKLGLDRPELWIGLQTGEEDMGTLARVCLAFGAGIHEEFVFRLGLFTGMVWGLSKLMERVPSILVAVFVSSLLFSLAHYLGAEPFALYSFSYRFLAGVLFCVLFATRGFAIAVYTHAIYDVLVMVVFK